MITLLNVYKLSVTRQNRFFLRPIVFKLQLERNCREEEANGNDEEEDDEEANTNERSNDLLEDPSTGCLRKLITNCGSRNAAAVKPGLLFV